MKVGKIIGRVALGALALSVVPYQFKKDEETGSIEVRSLHLCDSAVRDQLHRPGRS